MEYFLQIFYLRTLKYSHDCKKPTAETLGNHFSNFSHFYISVFCWKNAFSYSRNKRFLSKIKGNDALKPTLS